MCHPLHPLMRRILLLTLGLSAGWMGFPVNAQRIKDLATVEGIRSNQLLGYGLVVGLDGSGDKGSDSPQMVQSLRSMLARLGVNIPADLTLKPKNVAAVMLHAELPPFAKVGQKIDVTASSMGNASSLRGGTLLLSPLRGADGQVYGMAQGDLLVGGLTAGGADGSKVTINSATSGRVPNGGTVERTVETPFASTPTLTFNLKWPDFTTANHIGEAINKAFNRPIARASDAGSVVVMAPPNPGERVAFMSKLEELEIQTGRAPARVIISARTGTVVINGQVRAQPAAVSHGNLTVSISENAQVSQPNPASGGETVVTPQSNVSVSEEKKRMFVFDPGVKLEEIVRAVNQVGAAPSDVVAILQALKQAGALEADLIVN
ncbi:flagellar P-ring protein [Gammaproteobacteria bacterium]